MITKDQAVSWNNTRFHYCPDPTNANKPRKHGCYTATGPKGADKSKSVICRRNGDTKIWKTRPTEFRLPFKYGMYEHGYITPENAADFYVDGECPICNRKENPATSADQSSTADDLPPFNPATDDEISYQQRGGIIAYRLVD